MLRNAAQLLSFVFHPLLILTYILIVWLLLNPYEFGVYGIRDRQAHFLIGVTLLTTFIIPGMCVLIMYKLEMVDSWTLRNKQDRVGPFIITGVLYLWMFLQFNGSSVLPRAFAVFTLGIVLSLLLGFLINLFDKISLHAMGMGGLVGMLVLTLALSDYWVISVEPPVFGFEEISLIYLILGGVFFAGLVGTARLVLQAHQPSQIYGGYLVGFATQFLALQLIG